MSPAQSRPARPARSRSRLAPVTPSLDKADLCEVDCVDVAKVDRVRRTFPPRETIAALADTFKALGDPTRLRIVAALAREELCVCDLATLVDVTESAVSHSLRALRKLRVVRYRKVGKIAYYSLDDAHVARLVAEGLVHVSETGARTP